VDLLPLDRPGAVRLDSVASVLAQKCPGDKRLSITQQCQLLDLPRSTYYHAGVGESDENLKLMRLINEQYLHTPFYGSRGMTQWLIRHGYEVHRKRVQRLMRVRGLEAIYPRRRTSVPCPEHRIYPYLLRHLAIERPNQVWSADIKRLGDNSRNRQLHARAEGDPRRPA